VKKQVYLHIGYSKTGTTAIQNFLFFNREKLKTCFGILYPISCFNDNHLINHQNLSHSLLKTKNIEFPHYINPENYPDNPDVFWQKLISEIDSSDCERIVISSEAFIRFRDSPDLIDKVKLYLNKYDVKIICYLRRQVEFFESGYNQKVKADLYYKSVCEFVNLRFKHIDFMRDLNEWASVFGKNNLIVRIYSKCTLPNGIVPDLLSVLNIKFNDYFSALDSNLRLPNRYVPLKKMLNKIRFQQLMENKKINSILLYMGKDLKSEYSLIPANLKYNILEFYNKSNNELAYEFFHGVYPFSTDVEKIKEVPFYFFPIDLVRFLFFSIFRKKIFTK
jgi:hypothetical protein